MITVLGNLKGGTGKSTVAFNLAIWLLSAGKQVKVFDLDPQKTLSDVVQVRQDEGYEPALVISTDLDELDDTQDTSALEVVVDVGVHDMTALERALTLATRIVVPVLPSQADIWSTQRFLTIARKIAGGRRLDMVGFVNRADTHIGLTETDEAEQALDSLPGLELIDIRLYQRTAYRRSFSEGLAVFEMGPSSKASREFMKLAKCLYPQ
jgi:chromosome partitioning protein